MKVGPRGAGLPTRDTRVVPPGGKAGPGAPWHRDQREKLASVGRAEAPSALSSSFPSSPYSALKAESQLCRQQLMPSTRPRMSLQPRSGLLLHKNVLISPHFISLISILPYPCPQATEDQMRLLRLQRRLEDELGGQFLDLPLHDTVTNLILGGHNKRAEQLARDFRIPDKR